MNHQGQQKLKERRWAVISSDGRHSWLGRHTDPSDDEVASVSAQLASQGIAAWLAVTEGSYYRKADRMTVVMVRSLAGTGDWETAWAAFLAIREDALSRA